LKAYQSVFAVNHECSFDHLNKSNDGSLTQSVNLATLVLGSISYSSKITSQGSTSISVSEFRSILVFSVTLNTEKAKSFANVEYSRQIKLLGEGKLIYFL